jgi:hypothetical protein
MPPDIVFLKSHIKAAKRIAAPVKITAASRRRARRPRCSAIRPQTTIVKATTTGDHTGPTHGTGIKNSMSQVLSDCGQ